MSTNKQPSEERCVVIRSGFGEEKQIRVFTGKEAERIKQVLKIPLTKEGEENA